LKQPRKLQKTAKQKHQDDDVTSEESDADLLVRVALVAGYTAFINSDSF